MSLARGRVVRAPASATAIPLPDGRAASWPPRGRRLERASMDAAERAGRLLEAAMQRASAILENAERRADEIRLAAAEAGKVEGLATVAALSVALRDRESRADEHSLDRIVALSRLLAERLLGHALRTDPHEVAALAAQALAEAGGARKVELRAHPVDAALLRSALGSFDPNGRVHAVVEDDSLARGDLRLNTELGMVDARLGSELSRLAERLREALTP